MKTQSAALDQVLEEVVLNWTDLTGKKTGATQLGSNKFYRAQIGPNGGGYTVVFCYGRVGQDGQTQTVSCATLDEARSQRDKKIREKIAKGYTRVETRSLAEERTKQAAKAPKTVKASVRSKSFHPEVEALLRLVYGSTGQAISAGLSASAGATPEAPLGSLSDTQLDKGADVLLRIEQALTKKKKPARDQLVELTDEYLSAVPRNVDHARKGGKLDLEQVLVNSKERVAEQRAFLTLLRDASLQREVFAAAAEVEDPVEVWYDGLACDIEHVAPKSAEYARIEALFTTGQSPINANFHGKLKLARVWKLEQQGRRAAFDAYAASIADKAGATGVIPGWHGTRTENLMGVCKTGLLMPKNLPKGVQVTGRAFGLGIYHTPCWPDAGKGSKDERGKKFVRYNGALKSLNYSSLRGAFYVHSSADRGYMFLEDLALGVPELALAACFDKPTPEVGCDYIYARAHGHASLANDEVVTFDEHASRRTALVEVVYK